MLQSGNAGQAGTQCQAAEQTSSWLQREEQTRTWEAERSAEWTDLDRRLRAVAKERGALDAKEAELLREAEALQLWRAFGYAGLLEYMERAMGYSPHTAMERLRVAKALVELPRIAEALENGEIKHSAVRELTRVASSDTEAEWLRAVQGKSLREIEPLVAGRKPGSRPEDPPESSLRRRKLTLELQPEAYEMLRQAQAVLAETHGHRLSPEELIVAMCRLVLESVEGGAAATATAANASEAGEARARTLMSSRPYPADASGPRHALAGSDEPRPHPADASGLRRALAGSDAPPAHPADAAASRHPAAAGSDEPRPHPADAAASRHAAAAGFDEPRPHPADAAASRQAVADAVTPPAHPAGAAAPRHTAATDSDERPLADAARGAVTGSLGGGSSGRPAYQLAIKTCPDCKRSWQYGGGRDIEVGAEVVERARCDAEHIGSLDEGVPARKTTTLTKRVREHVFARDGYACAVPGCRRVTGLDIHHIQFQEHGGSHEPANLVLICNLHHAAVHTGKLVISGRAPHRLDFAFPRGHARHGIEDWLAGGESEIEALDSAAHA